MRQFLLTFQLLSQFFTRKVIWLIMLALGVALAIINYYLVYRRQLAVALHMTAYAQIMLTLIFMMMGIELRREQRRAQMDDMIAVYSKNAWIFPFNQLLVLGFFDFVVTIMIMLGCLVRMKIDKAPTLWINQTLAYIILLYFLPCWFFAAWGLFIAQINRKRSVYLPAMLVWLVLSTLFAEIFAYVQIIAFSEAGFLLNMMNLGIINFHLLGDFMAGAPIEKPFWLIRLGLLVFCSAFFLAAYAAKFVVTRPQKYQRLFVKVTLGISFISFLFVIGLNYAVFYKCFADPDAVQSYVTDKHLAYQAGLPVSLADYPLEKHIDLIATDIDLDSTSQGIKAVVRMQAQLNKSVQGQSFTLYSDLVLDEVLVDGEVATIERNHDGLMVYFPTSKQAGEQINFVFRYHGYSLPIYPANESTIQFNRAFPWIPWPGIKIYHDFYKDSQAEAFFIEDWQRGDLVNYTLAYQGPGHLYTNLAAVEDGVYKGASSNGVSLYSGMVHYRHRATDIYVPASQYNYANWGIDALLDAYDSLLDLCEQMDAIHQPKKPQVIALVQIPCPLVNAFLPPQEPYSWGDEWEIRQYGDSSATVLRRKQFGQAQIEYQQSTEVKAKMAVAYLLTPCAGYPVDVTFASTQNYAAWLSMYLHLANEDWSKQNQDMITYYEDLLRNDFAGSIRHSVKGQYVAETPLTQKEQAELEQILVRMRAGESFAEPFKLLYQRLLQSEMITAADIVAVLSGHEGE